MKRVKKLTQHELDLQKVEKYKESIKEEQQKFIKVDKNTWKQVKK